MIQHPPIPPDPNRTEEELLLLRTGASTAFEAIMDGNLPMAEQLFHDYAVRVPDDWNAYLALGEIQAARGHITDASQSWMTYVEHGGDFPVALDHIVRSVVAHDSALLRLEHPDPRELAARCLHVSPEWSDPLLHDISLQVAGELAQYRKKLKSRRKYYESCFKKIPPGSDLYLVILPFLSFIAGYPPHGAGLLWHHIRGSNHTCEILDFNLMLHNALDEASLKNDWWQPAKRVLIRDPFKFMTRMYPLIFSDMESWVGLIKVLDPRRIGFSCMQVNRQALLRLTPMIRRAMPDVRIILGGPDCFYCHKPETRFDAIYAAVEDIVMGEGETAMDAILQEAAPETRQPRIIHSSHLPLERMAGFPKFDKHYIRMIPKPRIGLMGTSRGCVNHCDFCADRMKWRPFRPRPVRDIVDEISYNLNKLGTKDFFFADSATNASIEHLEQLCDALIRQVKGISISTSVMVRSQMTPRLFDKMVKAGFRILKWGIETGSDTVLEAMGKRGRIADAERNLRDSRNAGMSNFIFIMLGHPAEGDAEVEETIGFLRRNHDVIDLIEMMQPCYIQQGTRLAENMNQKGIVVPGDLYEFGSWILDGNNLFERQHRVHEVHEEAVRLGIPVN